MKRLTKSSTNRVMSGILGGVGEYFNIDPVIIRILFVIFSIATGGWGGVVLYIIGMVIIPEGDFGRKSDTSEHSESTFETEWTDSSSTSTTREWSSSSSSGARSGGLIIGIIFILIGGVFLLNNLLDYNILHYVMKFREYFWGTILVAIGLLLIFLGGKKR